MNFIVDRKMQQFRIKKEVGLELKLKIEKAKIAKAGKNQKRRPQLL
jgi:hypothetical protein